MTTTITRVSDSATTSPDLVLGYATDRAGRNIVHDLLGGDGIAVVLIAPRPRSGTLELFYTDEADAWAALELHTSTADSFTLADTDRPAIGMAYVLDSSGVSLALDEETRDHWVVSVNYQETP